MGARDLNSGSHECLAGILLIEPSLQPTKSHFGFVFLYIRSAERTKPTMLRVPLTVTNLIQDVEMKGSPCSEAEYQDPPAGLELAM